MWPLSQLPSYMTWVPDGPVHELAANHLSETCTCLASALGTFTPTQYDLSMRPPDSMVWRVPRR